MKQAVLVTGASSGIGLHLAREFAEHGHPLLLVAPVEQELQSVAGRLAADHRVPVEFIAKDLEQPDAVQDIVEEAARRGCHVDILVNNAGRGQLGKFWEIPLDTSIGILRLNVEAVLRLTHALLPPMIQRGRGRVLNVASVAGFEPGPMLAVYHATKAFVLSLTEALATELKDTGVTATALCPGPTDTDFFPKADMVQTAAFQKAHVMPPQDVAKRGYEAVMRGERVVVTGAVNKAMVFARHLMPESAQAKKQEKLYQDVEPEDTKRVRGQEERDAEKKRIKKAG